MKLFVGLDVNSFDIKVCFLNGEGDQINSFTVNNDLPGATTLSDENDAFVIADYMRFGRLPMSVVKEEQYVALQQLTRARYQIIRQITQEKQRFLQYLSYKCNTFTEDVTSSVFGKAMLDLFQESYSLEELSQMDLEELADYLRVKGKNRSPDAEQVAKSIQKAARSSYRLDKVWKILLMRFLPRLSP